MKIEYIYRAFFFFLYQNYKIKRKIVTEKMERVANSFIQEIEKKYDLQQLGEEWLWKYFLFQFNYWKSAKLKAGTIIDLALIVGRKALSRYEDRDRGFDWQLIEDSRKYSRESFRKAIRWEKECEESVDVDIDDVYRRRFYNTEKGFEYCLTYTMLFNPKSKFCQSCNFIDVCKESQKNIHQEFYKSRVLNGK